MDNTVFETHDLRVRIEDQVARIDQRRLEGELWREIDHSDLPMTPSWLVSKERTSALKIALWAFELENPGNMTLRDALSVQV
jgi:hypothetical protein